MSTTHDTEALAPELAPAASPAAPAASTAPSRTDEGATGVAFSRRASCGLVTIEPFAADPYAVCLRRWLAHPASAAWQMAGLSTDEVRAYLAAIDADPHQQAWLGRVDGEPTFFVETYDPAEVLLTEVHDAEPGDVGMHLLVAPPRGQRVHA